MARKRLKFTEALRKAIDESPMSRYEICKRAGIAQSGMSRFMAGKGGFTLPKLDALCEVLGIEITARPKQRTKRKKNHG